MSEAAKLTDELKPCPFCSSTRIAEHHTGNQCGTCAAIGPSPELMRSAADANAAWNTRSSLPPDAAGERPARDAMTDWRNGENMAVQNSRAAFADLVDVVTGKPLDPMTRTYGGVTKEQFDAARSTAAVEQAADERKTFYCLHCEASLGKWPRSESRELACEFCGKTSEFVALSPASTRGQP